MRTRFSPLVVALSAVSALFLSNSSDSLAGQSPRRAPKIYGLPDADSSVVALAQDYNTFGLELLRTASSTNPDVNYFLSPINVAVGLGMLMNGASGSTAKELAAVLKVSDYGLPAFNHANRAISGLLHFDGPELRILSANSIWMSTRYSFQPEFLNMIDSFFAANPTALDYDDLASVDIINRWVSQQTNGMIRGIIDRLTNQHMLMLTNAIYFKGSWSNEFEVEKTKDQPFSLLNRVRIQVPLMEETGKFSYFETATLQAVKLPYRDPFTAPGDDRIVMYVFLPDTNASFADFVSGLSFDLWQTWQSKFERKDGTIKLPRFSIDCDTDLLPVLKRMGLREAFTYQADFTRMCVPKVDAKPALGWVRQKSVLRVDEKGSEAAATVLNCVINVGPEDRKKKPEPFLMVVDHPFVCAIVDEMSGAILFAGVIVNPQENEIPRP